MKEILSVGLQYAVGLTVTLLMIAISACIVGLIVNRKKKGTKSSFELNVKQRNLSTKYKDLDMKSFDDIGGLYEVKEELKKYVKCFDNRKEFEKQSVDIPKGILLWGPPGCGKTSLAKAIAYEAKVNFICRNASDLIGGGFFNQEGTISKLFEDARNMAPCIVFIDELDVLGARYSLEGSSGAHQVEITRFLAEMDGFQNNSGIMVIAATNDMTKLDTALLRSGRFGKKYFIGPPTTKKDIVEIVRMYAKDKRLSDKLTDDVMATVFNGSSPADIKDVLNECGVNSILNNEEITVDMLRKSLLEVNMRTNFNSAYNMSPRRRAKAAKHEAGHAVVSTALGVKVQTVTILSTLNGVRGLTNLSRAFSDIDEAEDRKYNNSETIQEVLDQATICYGGIAVELACGVSNRDLSLGSESDLSQATGMIDGLIYSTGYTRDLLFSPRSLGYAKIPYSEGFHNDVMGELRYVQDTAVKIVKDNMDVVNELAELLEKHITVANDKLESVLEKVKPFR